MIGNGKGVGGRMILDKLVKGIGGAGGAWRMRIRKQTVRTDFVEIRRKMTVVIRLWAFSKQHIIAI